MTTRPGRPTVLLVVASFVFAAMPHMAAMPPWIVAMILGAAAWRAAIAIHDLPRPGWILRIFITFGGLALVVAYYGTLWGRRAATVMLCVMVAAKLSEMFRLRDARIVAALAYFLIATQFLFSQRLVLFVYLVIGCWLTTAALLQVQRDADDVPAGSTIGSALRPVIRDGLAIIALAAPFAVVLFMLFPRLASPLWGMPDEALDGRTGLSDEMTPGSITELFADDSPAFRASFDDGAPPPRSRLYWRGPVLWRFDGRTWRRLDIASRRADRLPPAEPGSWSYTVQQEPTERRWMFALDYPVSAPEEARVTSDYTLVREQPITSLIAYDVISNPLFVDSPSLQGWMRRIALYLPEDSNPRTRAFARSLRERFENDRELIEEVLAWFNREPFFYSLQTSPLGRNGADEFLFDLRVGYCEYYASAFAVLMRAAGIPTRVVTGYQGGFWQAADQYLLVRQSDAHAWNEVWLSGEGWTRVDPTAAVAPERVSEGARSAVAGGAGWFAGEWLYAIRNQYDRLQNLWNRWVLGFDDERQSSLLERLGLGELSSAARSLALLALAALALIPLALLWHALALAPLGTDPLQRRWKRVRFRLRRAGMAPGIGETPFELAERVSTRLVNGDELLTLAARYSRLRYGGEASAEARTSFFESARRWRPEPLNPSGLRASKNGQHARSDHR